MMDFVAKNLVLNDKNEYTFYPYLDDNGFEKPFSNFANILPTSVYQPPRSNICLPISMVQSVDSRYRLFQSHKLFEYRSIPTLSIQNAVDGSVPGNVHSISKFIIEEGVTTEKNYAYFGYKGPLLSNSAWKRYNCADVERYRHVGVKNIKNYQAIVTMFNELDLGGPFVGGYTVRDTHVGNSVFTADGPATPKRNDDGTPKRNDDGSIVELQHAVMICGFRGNWCPVEGKWKDYWKYQDSRGPDWNDDNGCGRLDFEALDLVLIPIISLTALEPFYEAA